MKSPKKTYFDNFDNFPRSSIIMNRNMRRLPKGGKLAFFPSFSIPAIVIRPRVQLESTSSVQMRGGIRGGQQR